MTDYENFSTEELEEEYKRALKDETSKIKESSLYKNILKKKQQKQKQQKIQKIKKSRHYKNLKKAVEQRVRQLTRGY